MWLMTCLKTAVVLRQEVMECMSCPKTHRKVNKKIRNSIPHPHYLNVQTFAPVPETHALILKQRGL